MLSVAATFPILLLAIIKYLVPGERVKSMCTQQASLVGTYWALANRRFYFMVHSPQWQVSKLDNLSPDRCYLIISNHQSWTDIAVLIFLLIGRTSPMKFFLKQELIWLPFVGIACWVLDFPFMKRYSKEEIAANPALRIQDQERTRRFCEKLRNNPASIINYVEGTRFTPEKHKAQASTYRYLLKPKSGGMAYVIGAIGDQIDKIVDVTIIYRGGRQDFFGFLCGQIDPIVVDIRERTIPPRILAGDYQESDAFRAEFQDWVAQLWREKDALIASHIDSK